MEKKTVAVLFGGRSSEHGVSLESAYSVIRGLDPEKYRVIPVGITKSGEWYIFEGDPIAIRDGSWERRSPCPVLLNPGSAELLIPREHPDQAIKVDCLLPILHGRNGEDGTVQGLAELASIPLAGCRTLSSALCMDKARAHALAQATGIRVPRSVIVGRGEDYAEATAFAREIGYPVFVKPIRAGSSIGITKVTSSDGLKEALELALSHDREAAVEEFIDGVEIGCAILGRAEKLTVGDLVETELPEGFFDYTEKYTHKSCRLHIPARIDADTAARIKALAARIYRLLDCAVFARVDIFLTKDGDLVFNEVNTIPGMTEISLYPAMMASAGIDFRELLTRIVELGMEG